MSFEDATAIAPTLTKPEVKKLLGATARTKGAEREHMIYSLALATGLREHELCALTIGDVVFEKRIRTRIKLVIFKGSNRRPLLGPDGKPKRARLIRQIVYLPKMTRAKLDYFLKWKKKNGEALHLTSPLFCVSQVGFGAQLGDRLSERSVRFHFRRWQKRLGFEELHGFHVLRHTAVSNFYRVTKDIRNAQQFARHASVNTTQIYTHLTDDEIAAAIEDLEC